MEAFNFDQVITHSTIFHADDIFGVAMCRLINPDIKIIRTLEVDKFVEMANNIGEKVIVFDIGLGKYDHHQENKALRPDGTPYCGFGLLWRDYGYLLCPEKEAWDKVDSAFVLAIDKADNGVAQNLLSSSFKAMNPNWNSVESESVAFHRAMNIAMILLKAQIDQANAAVEAKDMISSFYDGGPILVMDRYLPWTDTVLSDTKFKDVLYAVFPSKRGGWNVQTVPKQAGTFINRMDFPKEWLGHADPERGITFAHTANFLIACETKEQAVKVAEEAVEAGSAYASLVCSV